MLIYSVLWYYFIYNLIENRNVAQFGSAPCSGRGGRRFKSCHSDFFEFCVGGAVIQIQLSFINVML